MEPPPSSDEKSGYEDDYFLPLPSSSVLPFRADIWELVQQHVQGTNKACEEFLRTEFGRASVVPEDRAYEAIIVKTLTKHNLSLEPQSKIRFLKMLRGSKKDEANKQISIRKLDEWLRPRSGVTDEHIFEVLSGVEVLETGPEETSEIGNSHKDLLEDHALNLPVMDHAKLRDKYAKLRKKYFELEKQLGTVGELRAEIIAKNARIKDLEEELRKLSALKDTVAEQEDIPNVKNTSKRAMAQQEGNGSRDSPVKLDSIASPEHRTSSASPVHKNFDSLKMDVEKEKRSRKLRFARLGAAKESKNSTADLLPKWIKHWDEKTGHAYFENIETKETTWEQPSEEVMSSNDFEELQPDDGNGRITPQEWGDTMAALKARFVPPKSPKSSAPPTTKRYVVENLLKSLSKFYKVYFLKADFDLDHLDYLTVAGFLGSIYGSILVARLLIGSNSPAQKETVFIVIS